MPPDAYPMLAKAYSFRGQVRAGGFDREREREIVQGLPGNTPGRSRHVEVSF